MGPGASEVSRIEAQLSAEIPLILMDIGYS